MVSSDRFTFILRFSHSHRFLAVFISIIYILASPSPSTPTEPSISQAQPGAIALAGPGGVAAAAPRATALVGDGGLAVSSPQATAVAGPTRDEQPPQKKNNRKP